MLITECTKYDVLCTMKMKKTFSLAVDLILSTSYLVLFSVNNPVDFSFSLFGFLP